MDYFVGDAKSAADVVLVVADGHGSARCVRSDRGSRFAAEVAVEAGRELLATSWAKLSFSEIKHQAEDRLPRTIVSRWRDRVDADIREEPLPVEGSDPYLAYGSTLVLVLISADWFLCAQLGDGDVLRVDREGRVARPIPGDARLFGNETTSLASPDAWREFRVIVEPVVRHPLPTLVLVTTDGYPNSFRTDDGFLRSGTDFLQALREDGSEAVEAQLEGWLREASDAGSGDDVTVVLAFDTRDVQPQPPSVGGGE